MHAGELSLDMLLCDLQGLKKLNAVGYGQPGSGLVLDLVYNPGGAFLAPPQAKLQPAYEQELQQVCICNPVPQGRRSLGASLLSGV